MARAAGHACVHPRRVAVRPSVRPALGTGSIGSRVPTQKSWRGDRADSLSHELASLARAVAVAGVQRHCTATQPLLHQGVAGPGGGAWSSAESDGHGPGSTAGRGPADSWGPGAPRHGPLQLLAHRALFLFPPKLLARPRRKAKGGAVVFSCSAPRTRRAAAGLHLMHPPPLHVHGQPHPAGSRSSTARPPFISFA